LFFIVLIKVVNKSLKSVIPFVFMEAPQKPPYL